MSTVASLEFAAPPIVAVVATATTLVTCVAVAKANDRYLGGLTWPYFSDMGRDSPGYEVFCVGLTITSLALVLTWRLNLKFQRRLVANEVRERPNEPMLQVNAIRRLATAVVCVGVASALGLPVLAFCSTTSFPDVHQYAAYWFFVLEAVAVLLNNVTSYKLLALVHSRGKRMDGYGRYDPWRVSATSVLRTFYLQTAVAVAFVIAFALYIPVGLAIIQPFQRLTVQECLDRNLGVEYCSDTMRLDDVDTRLWNYENDAAANQLRAASQLVCIATLAGYALTFLSHNRAALQDYGAA